MEKSSCTRFCSGVPLRHHRRSAVNVNAARAVVLRTNMFGAAMHARQSLAEWILAMLRKGDPVPGFTDIRFSPLYVAALGRTIARVAESKLTGLYHAGAADGISKFEFARALAETFGHDPDLVRPTTSNEAGWRAPRPRDTTLVSSRLARELGGHAPSIADGMAEFAADVSNASPEGDEESR